ncbi:MAG: ATP-binding protein [Bacteroidetes bacterium]|nr:ATP-binding protein [Bacteroidota bacterium]
MNTVKFSNKGGGVEVKILQKRKLFEVIVCDHGVGIPAGDVKKLFRIDEKYKSLGTEGESGTGLGLVLCKEFVDKNGGGIWCKTEEGSGTEFHFTIPRYTSEHLNIL